MTPETPDMRAVLERLEKVEKQKRRLKQGGRAGLLRPLEHGNAPPRALRRHSRPGKATLGAGEFWAVEPACKIKGRLHVIGWPEIETSNPG